MDLNTTWFLLVGVLLTGYAILDGFDLGVGVLHLFARDNHTRRLYLNAIAPVWDGNEVWLLTGGGALFAAFPPVYATVFSGFYIAMMLVLVALIFRAVAIEFRGKVESESWRKAWDYAFAIGSLLLPILLGVALGNILGGIPINSAGDFTGSFLGLLNPYAVLVGLLTLALFTLHGAVYLTLKTDGQLRQRLARIIPGLWIAFFVLLILATVASRKFHPYLFGGLMKHSISFIAPLLLLISATALFIFARKQQFGRAFIASSLMIASLMAVVGLSLFPMLVPSSTDPNNSLTIYNSSSTPGTLKAMFIIALIGMPLVLAYTAAIYSVFKGKVVLDEHSY
jgi:cytochrome bd ubiquinol oxidase subunit II